ncbi:MAG TPA: Gfo/Idh/MocA family oxidoreductase [Thermohalobaculum sp.]|nr:Gfo/Idh/MocA family oxidoreductase [Thermohalobaculum sp.]
MTRPRIALVGLGMAIKPHAESYLDLADRVEVAWAWSPSAARRAAFAERYPFPLAESLDQILADDTVTAVGIQTPPNTHLDLVRRCAAAGKHVLLEKPLEVDWPRSLALVEACEQAGVTLAIMLQHRFRSAGVRLREIIDEGTLGRPIGGHVSVLNWRPQSYYDQPGRGERARDGGGVLMTQAIHTLDLFLTLMGLPEEVAAHASTTPVHAMETEDLVTGSLRYASGAQVSLMATTAANPGFPETILLLCERGSAEISGTSLRVHFDDGRVDILDANSSTGGTGANPMDFPHDHHRAAIADFLDAIETGRSAFANGRSVLDVHQLIGALLDSAAAGRPIRLAQS